MHEIEHCPNIRERIWYIHLKLELSRGTIEFLIVQLGCSTSWMLTEEILMWTPDQGGFSSTECKDYLGRLPITSYDTLVS